MNETNRCAQAPDDEEQDDEDEDGKGSGKKETKWVDIDRAIAKAMRSWAHWVRESQAKCEAAWRALRDLQSQEKTTAVADKVRHDLTIANCQVQSDRLCLRVAAQEFH